MKKKKDNLNYIAALEKAVMKKYGKEAIDNPAKYWTPEKEKEYLEEMRRIELLSSANNTIEEREGFLFSTKLFKKETKNICNICFSVLKEGDMVYITKYDCCRKCYVNHVEGREERWLNGWRPENV
tara:strand:- start:356 stop:733 length:378 start_codon:yes stop_codon:yes gene_type:complete